jgi:DNA repair protein RadC
VNAVQVAFLTAMLIALTISFSRGGTTERLVAALVLVSALVSPLLQTGRFNNPQALIAGVDMLLLIGLIAVAAIWHRRWLLVAIACQALTVAVQIIALLGVPLSRELYGLLTIIWAYPLLASLAWGAWHNRPFSVTQVPMPAQPAPTQSGLLEVSPAAAGSSSNLEIAARLFRQHGCGDRADALAELVVARAGSFAAAIQQPPDRLRRWGLDEQAIAALALARDTLTAALRPAIEEQPVLANSAALLDYLRAQLGHLREEQLLAYFLNTHNRLLGEISLGSGSVSEVLVLPRQVLRTAIDMSASSVILAHNHPSGDPSPSRQDIAFTRQVASALRPAGIQLIDHLIITKSGHVSLRSRGYV